MISDLARISLTPTLDYVTFCQLQIEEICHGCEIPLLLFTTGNTFISWTCGNLLSFAFNAVQSITKGHLFMVHMMGSHKVFKIAYQGMYFTL